MVYATNLGYSRIGAHRELKKALEHFWSGKIGEAELFAQAVATAAWPDSRPIQ